jgi:hypothetical protein
MSDPVQKVGAVWLTAADAYANRKMIAEKMIFMRFT